MNIFFRIFVCGGKAPPFIIVSFVNAWGSLFFDVQNVFNDLRDDVVKCDFVN